MRKYLLITLLLMISISAYSDAGIPLIMLEFPVLILSFIPVVGIESFVLFNY